MADKKTSARTYHVLSPTEGRVNTFFKVAEIEASSSEQAIRLTASEHGAGRYIAVPDRSWTEIGVRVETPAPRVILDSDNGAAAQAKQAEPA